MAETSIEWTRGDDGSKGWTINPIRAHDPDNGRVGHHCEKVSPGCASCYAERLQKRLRGSGKYIRSERDRLEHFLDDSKLQQVLKRRKPTRIFWCDMTDMFGEWVPFEWIDRCFAVMALTPQHTHQVLTKRPDRAAEYMSNDLTPHRIAKNIDAIHVSQQIKSLPETWKDIKGFPRYEVSSHGNVRSSTGQLSPDIGTLGHSRVTLFSSGHRFRFLVHHLVLTAFDRPKKRGEQALHRNGDATCNAIPNLRWGTQSENWDDSRRHGSHRRYSKLCQSDVQQIRERFSSGESSCSISKDFPVSDTQIRNIVRSDQWGTEPGVDWPIPGVWLGTSVEDQQSADVRREHLQSCPAAVRFVSYEPALGPVDWTGWEFVDWIISGGESGPKARTSHPDWHRATRDFCGEHGIAYLFKQRGAWTWDSPEDGCNHWGIIDRSGFFMPLTTAWNGRTGDDSDTGEVYVYRVGKKAAGRLLDGREHNEFPERA